MEGVADAEEEGGDDVPIRFSLVDLDDTPISSTWLKKAGTLVEFDMAGKRELLLQETKT